MNNYPSNYADEIKRRLPAREVFERYGFHVNREGYACCPFHGEKTPSCKVYPGDRGWHCFGCHAGGDVLDFAQQYFGLNFQEAAAKLNDDFGLGIPIGRTLNRAEQEEAKRREAERRRKAEEKRQRLQALQDAYEKALAEYAACDTIMLRCAPISPATGFSDVFCWAAKNIDRAWYELKEAEAALFAEKNEEQSA